MTLFQILTVGLAFLSLLFILTANKLTEAETDLGRSQEYVSDLKDKIYNYEVEKEKRRESYSNLLKENECMREQLEKLLLLYTKNKFIEDASFVEEYLNLILEKEGDSK